MILRETGTGVAELVKTPDDSFRILAWGRVGTQILSEVLMSETVTHVTGISMESRSLELKALERYWRGLEAYLQNGGFVSQTGKVETVKRFPEKWSRTKMGRDGVVRVQVSKFLDDYGYDLTVKGFDREDFVCVAGSGLVNKLKTSLGEHKNLRIALPDPDADIVLGCVRDSFGVRLGRLRGNEDDVSRLISGGAAFGQKIADIRGEVR